MVSKPLVQHDIPEISFVIPTYNEEDNVVAMCAAVTAEAEQHASSHEIIFIDNGSTDKTRDLLRQLCAADKRVRAIFNNRNYGQMRSPTHGIYQASGRAVIALCADFQDPPALIGTLIGQWRAGAQIVLCQRRTEKTGWMVGAIRKIGYGFLERYADYPVIHGATGFGIYDRLVVDHLATWNEPEPFFRGMLVESGYRLAVLPYDRPERAAGKTKNNLMALLDFAVSGVAGSSKSLLRKPIFLSAWIAVAAFLVAVVSLLAPIWGLAMWPFLLAALQLGIFSILMLFIGLMGEQVRVISERTRGVPLVIEAERINFREAAEPDRSVR